MPIQPLATAFVLIRPTTTGFGPVLKRELDGAAGAAGSAGSKAGKSWTKGFQSSGVTKAANKITEGIVAAGVASVVMAAKFQSSMEKISTQAGVSQGKIKGLSDGILQLAGKVGFSPDSLATSLYHVESSFESLGITSKKALQLVKIAAEGAAVGGADLEDVTNALTAVMASGIKVTHGMSGAMGILNQVVGVGDMKMQDLADAFGTGLLASIKGFGVSITDAGAALATFGDNNIRGAKAGQQLRMAIQALAAPTGAGKKILEGWGLSVDRFAKDMQKGGLRKALEDLQAQFKKVGLTSKEQGQVLTELFGKRAGVGIQILVGQMDRFQSKYKALAEGAGKFGDAWAKTQATAAQQGRELGHGLEALGVTIGEKLLPPLMAVFGFIRTHTGLVLTLAGVVGGLAVAISAVSLGIRVYEAAVGIATAAQWLWNAALDANPIGIVIIAVAALVTAIILLWKHAAWFRDAIKTVWSAIKTAFDAVWGALKTAFAWVHEHWKLLAAILFGPIGLAVDAIVTHWKTVSKVFAVFWGWLKIQWQAVYDWIIKPISKAAMFIFNIWKSIITGTADLILKIKNFFAPAIHWLFDAGKNVIGGLFGGMWHAVGAAASWVARIGGKILHAVTSFFGIHSPSTVFFGIGGHLIAGLFQGMVHGASGLAGWVIKQISHIGGSVLSGLLHLLGIGGNTSGSPGKMAGSYQQYAESILSSFGWSPRLEMGPLIALWNAESGWSPTAQNRNSTAYGIAQFLDTTWAGFRYPKTSDGYKQIFDGLQYIKQRYGDPAAAWAFHQAHNWYGGGLENGLFTRPTLIGVGERGPELVNVTPAGRSSRPVVVLQFGGRAGGRNSLDDLLRQWLRHNVRVEGGGDVQVAFGGS